MTSWWQSAVDKGEAMGEAKILLCQLRRRFGEIRDDVVERIRTADITQLDDWGDRVLDAKTLADVFATDQRH